MITCHFLGLLFFLGLPHTTSSFSQAENTLTIEAQTNGWQLLFDGSDLADWRTYQQKNANSNWVADDAAIVLKGEAVHTSS